MNNLWVPNRSLHLPPVKSGKRTLGGEITIASYVELCAWDKNHRIIQQFREPMRSPVKQFLTILLSSMAELNLGSVIDTGGTSRSIAFGTARFYAKGAVNDDTKGIVIGTGSTAVDITDSKLVTKIADGVAATQMIYQVMQFDGSVTTTATDATFATWRNFNNNSGGSITVAETAIYVSATGFLFCAFRDVPTSLAVPDGGGCYVKYTLKITE